MRFINLPKISDLHNFLNLCLIGYLFFCCSASIAAQIMNLGEDKIVGTAYLNLKVEERIFPKVQRGFGGAITFFGDDLIVGKSDCTFARVNIRSWEYQDNFLPPLETGGDNLSKTKRYKRVELKPRVEGLIFHKNSFYVTFTRYNLREDLIYFVIAKISPGEKQWTDIYVSPGLNSPFFTLALGGKMQIHGDRLYFTVGDFSLDSIKGLPTDLAAQNIKLPWGKINYLDLRDNSFHVFSMGHRNPLGLIFLRDGRLLSSENGPQGGDEINLIKEGLNYGWPYDSYGTIYGSFREYNENLPSGSLKQAMGPFKKPIYVFIPSPAITDILEISSFFHKWDGDLLMGSLKAKNLYHMRLDGDKMLFVEPIALGHRIRSLQQLNKNFYVLNDDGNVLKISAITQEKGKVKYDKREVNRKVLNLFSF